MGYGVVRPSLGSAMIRVQVLGAVHFVFGVVYSIGIVAIPLESSGYFLFLWFAHDLYLIEWVGQIGSLFMDVASCAQRPPSGNFPDRLYDVRAKSSSRQLFWHLTKPLDRGYRWTIWSLNATIADLAARRQSYKKLSARVCLVLNPFLEASSI